MGILVMTEADFYVLIPSAFGALGLVWRWRVTGALVQRVLLPQAGATTEELVLQEFPTALSASCPAVTDLGEAMRRFLEGEAVEFSLDAIAWDQTSRFQQRVLRAEHGIPRGWVSTYGRIARHLGVSGGARAVGRALASNPFPIVIPCHRAIRAGGELGGYQGGVEMKRALLELEGVRFSATGRVVMGKVHYAGTGSNSR